MTFDSHLLTLVDVAARLVNELTSGHRHGQPFDAPDGPERALATARALGGDGRRTPEVTEGDADALAGHANAMRALFEACHRSRDGDLAEAAASVNAMLRDTGARPQLDPLPGGGWQMHFHGSDDSLAVGWGAGCATGLALAMGSDLAGRLGVCAAARCDRVYVDTSKNSSRRFCSTSCQNRAKAAAYRART